MSIEIVLKKCLESGGRRFELDAEFVSAAARIVFFGCSGSGKSMTLKAIAGLAQPDSGRIRVGARLLYDSQKGIFVRPQQRKTGYVPQDYGLFPHLDALGNVAFARSGLFARFLTRQQKAAALEWLERLGIGNLAARLPGQLSGGQQQRAALARALNSWPELLLLDEPFSALDPLLRGAMRREVQAILADLGIPVVIITHDPEDVAAFCGNLVLFKAGRARLIPDWPDLMAKNGAGPALRCLLAHEESAPA